MVQEIKRSLQRILKIFGVALCRITNSPQNRLSRTLKYFEIDTVLDVGANTGQFSLELRENGYKVGSSVLNHFKKFMQFYAKGPSLIRNGLFIHVGHLVI
ncbi:MAG: 2-polyprenyl-3-methyl-5-hydroxy-6-metoxy-1,4-benzoquinol methylase [Oleiphilaceae bacterium]|jgi:2-polyprenyl-3-methyl-5-hydroxy-6-metoxy-1,4-benzoquinol methylase